MKDRYETPYGAKTGRLLCAAMDTHSRVQSNTIGLVELALRALDEDSFPYLREALREEIACLTELQGVEE
jgi:hypothetical protein